jgi:transposase
MIGPSGRVRAFAYPHPCDMRKSFNTLSGLVSSMGHDVAAGDAFVFVGKNRKRAKVLWYDGSGLRLLLKRLDVGRFAALWREPGDEVTLTVSELSLLLDGCEVVGKMSLSPPPPDPNMTRRVSPASFR